ncbi:MAG: helicase-related protein [Patescibacteria group bacterium]
MSAQTHEQPWREAPDIDSRPPTGPADMEERQELDYATPENLQRLRSAILANKPPMAVDWPNLAEQIVTSVKEGSGMLLFRGETGSGKSIFSPTAVRKALDQLGRTGPIMVLQPRKDAALSVGTAIAAVQEAQLGREVGVATSEVKSLNPHCRVGVVTPGIMIRYMMDGKLTNDRVGAIVIDEVHEGSEDHQLILGLIKRMKAQGVCPPVIFMSATPNTELLTSYFGLTEHDYLEQKGRQHSVNTFRLKEHKEDPATGREANYMEEAAQAVHEVLDDSDEGDVLVFMPGKREIENTIRLIGEREGVEVVPLYGKMSPKDRYRILSGHKPAGIQRRVIVATNVAESSLTVPGIAFVEDSCRKRVLRYNPEKGMVESVVELISKDEARQRAGRAGRLGPGQADRMVTKEEYAKMPAHPESQIVHSPLLSLTLLRLKRLGLDERTFDFYEQPSKQGMDAARKELMLFGALDQQEQLTDLGREMIDLPFEPRLSRMVIESRKRHCFLPALVLAAFSRERGVFLDATNEDVEKAGGNKMLVRNEIKRLHEEFVRGGSDWLTALEVFRQACEHGVMEVSSIVGKRDKFRTPQERERMRDFDDWCKKYRLNFIALTHIAHKLRDYALRAHADTVRWDELGTSLGDVKEEDLSAVILSSFPDLCWVQDMYGEYVSALVGARVQPSLSPGSVAWQRDSRNQPVLCVSSQPPAEGGEGYKKKPYIHQIHPISVELFVQTFPQKVKREMGAPFYDGVQGRVVRKCAMYLKTQVVSALERDETEESLGKEVVHVTGEEACEAMAYALWTGQIHESFAQRNQIILGANRYLRRPLDLRAWYRERLKAHGYPSTRAEILEHQEEYYPPLPVMGEESSRNVGEKISAGFGAPTPLYGAQIAERRREPMRTTVETAYEEEEKKKLKEYREKLRALANTVAVDLEAIQQEMRERDFSRLDRLFDLTNKMKLVRTALEESPNYVIDQRHRGGYWRTVEGPKYREILDYLRKTLDSQAEHLNIALPSRTPKTPSQPVRETPMVPETMTPELRERILADLEASSVVLSLVETFGEKPTKARLADKKVTAFEKALSALYEGKGELERDMRSFMGELDDPSAKAQSMNGRLSALLQRIEPLFRKQASAIGFTAVSGWVDAFIKAWREVPTRVDSHPEVVEFIKDGTIDRAEMLSRVRKLLAEQVQTAPIQNQPINIDTLVTQVFNAF